MSSNGILMALIVLLRIRMFLRAIMYSGYKRWMIMALTLFRSVKCGWSFVLLGGPLGGLTSSMFYWVREFSIWASASPYFWYGWEIMCILTSVCRNWKYVFSPMCRTSCVRHSHWYKVPYRNWKQRHCLSKGKSMWSWWKRILCTCWSW